MTIEVVEMTVYNEVPRIEQRSIEQLFGLYKQGNSKHAP